MHMSDTRMDVALHGHEDLLPALTGGTSAAFLQATRSHLDTAWAALQGQR